MFRSAEISFGPIHSSLPLTSTQHPPVPALLKQPSGLPPFTATVTTQWYSACLGVSGFYPSSGNIYIIKNKQTNKARDVTELVECFPSILEVLGLIPSCIK